MPDPISDVVDPSTYTSATDETEASIEQTQNVFEAALNWVSENVMLVVNSAGILMRVFVNSTINTRATYTLLLCNWGVSCMPGSTMNVVIVSMWILTELVYAIGLLQFLSGRSLKDGE